MSNEPTNDHQPMPVKHRREKARWWVRMLKILAWTIMGVAMFLVASVGVVLQLLTPEHLTPMVTEVANRKLNAKVDIGRVELSIRESFPFVNVTVSDLSIVSTDMTKLPSDRHERIPQWTDTLLTLDQFHGGVNIWHLLENKLTFNDVELVRPGLNIVIVDEDTNNFSIFPPSEGEPTSIKDMPRISIKSFRVVDPKPLRYLDIEKRQRLTATFTQMYLSYDRTPVFNVKFDSNFDLRYPFLQLKDVPIAFNGEIGWNQSSPYNISLKDFWFRFWMFSGRLNTDINFDNELIINSFDVKLDPLSVPHLINEARLLGIDMPDVKTDATLNSAFELTRPYNVDRDMLPYFKAEIGVPECAVAWQGIDLRKFATDLCIYNTGETLNDITVDIKRLFMAGPATDLTIKGSVSNMLLDPTFDVTIDGNMVFDNFPPQIKNLLDGRLTGNLTANTQIKGSASMFTPSRIHALKINGEVDIDRFYYAKADTTTVSYVNHANITFDSNRRIRNSHVSTDSVLATTIQIDSMRMAHSNLAFNIYDIKLALGVANNHLSSDTTKVLPIGGGVKVGRFNMTVLTDSLTVRMRDIKGNLIVKSHVDNLAMPHVTAFLNIDRASAGDATTRMRISGSTLRLDAHKIAGSRGLFRLPPAAAIMADSIAKVYPNIPLDSIYSMTMQEYRRHRHPHPSEVMSKGNEVIDWETSHDLRELLTKWRFTGELKADRGHLFTRYFPVHNSMRNLDIAFNNDSLTFHDLRCKAGRSDFTLNGRVTNIRRALTSKSLRSPLRLHFNVESDTIDVNQLAVASFSGSDFVANMNKFDKLADDNEEQFESVIHDMPLESPDSIGPLLIPTNIEAELNVNARTVLYSDFVMHNLNGTVLAYDGALNLHNLRASSQVGNVDLSALYAAPNASDMKFGFGLKVSRFNIENFLNLVPAIDSVMPIMHDFKGIIDANIAATADIDRNMNLVIPSLRAAINLSGDSLVVLDRDTFRTIAKWLMFKDKTSNMIGHMAVELTIADNQLNVFPFIFDIDRYRLGVQGYNDLNMNFDYHIAVLKSPLPFKFGINIFGNPDKFKVRLGKARFNEKEVQTRQVFVNDTRISLLKQLENVFRRGISRSRFSNLNIDNQPTPIQDVDIENDTLSPADSQIFIDEGLIPAPSATEPEPAPTNKKNRKRK